eukprot:c11619_g1_i1 orf=148-1395(+)
MLGTACFRLCIHRGSQCPPALIHSHAYHNTPHPAQVTCRHAASISVCRSLSWPRKHHTYTNGGECRLQGVSSIKRPCCHSSSCVEERSGVSCATIWHGLLPSHHPSILDQGIISPLNTVSGFDPRFQSLYSKSSIVAHKDEESTRPCGSVSGVIPGSRKRYMSGLKFPAASMIGNGRFAMASGLVDGSWNVAWDVRPARWLHGRHSAWLLFGVCACFSAAAGLSVPNLPLPLSPLVHVQGAEEDSGCGSDCGIATAKDVMQGKQVFTDYTVTGIPGDGRCLFRAIAYGVCLRKGDPAPSESSQRELADELRGKVVDELVSRRADSEWFIEEDFDTYSRRMRECYVWGGEPELLMASHVLRMPIIVHIFDRSLGGIISIAEYGLEYGRENPIRVLYHGFGHYDAVQVPGIGTPSKL